MGDEIGKLGNKIERWGEKVDIWFEKTDSHLTELHRACSEFLSLGKLLTYERVKQRMRAC